MTPAELLVSAHDAAVALEGESAISDEEIRGRIDRVCRTLGNRAGVRLLMACMLAKVDRPEIDPRKPYTEIGDPDAFSGRTYDERYLSGFITEYSLPCNSTTAFLTPALRNHNSMLTPMTALVGRPAQMYADTLQVLDDVANGRVSAMDVLVEAVRVLIAIRDERKDRMEGLISALRHSDGALPLSTEGIITLLSQHLACKHSSRLPVLIVAAAYRAAEDLLGESARRLGSHLSADEQSGALGDVEIHLVNDENVVTVYEMKAKRVTRGDIDRAVTKILSAGTRPDNYIFITTDGVDAEVREHAASMYDRTNGVEIAILDCVGFLRHYLHFFHRLRLRFLDAYQELVLGEPESAVSQPLKESFLALRLAAESDEGD